MKIRRINLFGGPGISKSTTAAYIFTNLKTDLILDPNFSIELIQEFVKSWAYNNKKPTGFDQHYIFGHQLHREELPLRSNVSCIVTDSPLFISYCYANKYGVPASKSLLNIVNEFEQMYPSLNILLRRNNRQYKQSGRFETLEDAIKMDTFIENELINNNINYTAFNYTDKENMLSYIKEQL